MENNDQLTSIKSDPETLPSKKPTLFKVRSDGAVFGDQFISKQLIYTDENQHRYIVHQLAEDDHCFHVCPNKECGAIHPPANGSAGYCTACGTLLGSNVPKLVLTETISPIQTNLLEITKKHLSHGSVRAPIAALTDIYEEEERYCVVQPYTDVLDFRPPAQQVLEWSTDLAYGLDYLHTNGITFQGNVNASCIGLERKRAVWGNFKDCHIDSPLPQQEIRADINALVELFNSWLTGEPKFKEDPRVPTQLWHVFRQGQEPGGFSTAAKLGLALEQAIAEMSSPNTLDYRSGHRSNVGAVRSLNEDSLLVIETSRIVQSVCHPIGIYLVADGMGGHAAGEIASMTIVNSVAENAYSELFIKHLNSDGDIDFGVWLHNAIQSANQAVYDIRKSTASDLGSTVVSAIIVNNKAYIASVGDSRAYKIKEGEIRQITTDHTLVERMVAVGQITSEEARSHPQRNVIYRTVGDKERIEIDTYALSLNNGDQLLLCSDGLSGMISDGQILQIIKQAPSPQSACDALIAAANDAGGFDNISVILIETINS